MEPTRVLGSDMVSQLIDFLNPHVRNVKLQMDWKSNVRYTSSLLPSSLALNRTLLHDFFSSTSQ